MKHGPTQPNGDLALAAALSAEPFTGHVLAGVVCPAGPSRGSLPPRVARKPVRRRSAAAAVARRVPTARVAALFAEMITPGGGSAPALLVHRLGASSPRSGILEPWPSSRRPRSAAHIEPPAPPEPTAYLWPNDRRRKRSRPEARRVRRPLGLAWYQPLPPARLRPPARRRPPAADTPTRK